MAYTPTTWVTGDTVTATKMNKIENGIANAGSAMIVTEADGALDATFMDIYTALKDGIPVYVKDVEETSGPTEDYQCRCFLGTIFEARKYDNVYVVYARTTYEGQVSSDWYVCSPAVIAYRASGASGYPAFHKMVFPTNVSYID